MIHKLACAAFLFLASCTSVSAPAKHVSRLMRHEVDWDLGSSRITPGNAIGIEAVYGTRDTFEVGGSYLVVGRYKLGTAKRGTICLYLTADGWDNSGVDIDSQVLEVERGEGKFALLHEMPGPGRLHVVLYAADRTETLADVYIVSEAGE